MNEHHSNHRKIDPLKSLLLEDNTSNDKKLAIILPDKEPNARGKSQCLKTLLSNAPLFLCCRADLMLVGTMMKSEVATAICIIMASL